MELTERNAPTGGRRLEIHDVLREAVARRASDVLISAGSPVTYHVFGVLQHDELSAPLTPEDTERLLVPLMDDQHRRSFEEHWELDMGYELDRICRFRLSIFRQKGALGAVMRLIPLTIPHYSEIGISDGLLSKLLEIPQGLILVTGPTGAGKSTTVASFLQHMNTEAGMARHIVTIEDPIEFYINSNVCVVDQREIGSDTKGYLPGLRAALRQMPHIIFVGEMRDRPTMEIALTAAETGNIVISTLSTQSAAKTINRIIDVFPIHDQAEIRARLGLTLKAVISQVLLRRRDVPGRVAAREVLIVTSPVANLIREGKIHQINHVIASSYADGMVLLDDSLLALYNEGVVHAADVVTRLEDPDKARFVVGR